MFEARFQSFDDSSERAQSAARVAALRGELKRRGLDGFVVPRADRQQNEYLPASEERLAWLTGFTGSAGAAVVLADRAAVFADGRYSVQAVTQVDGKIFSIEHLVEHPPEQWLEQNLVNAIKLNVGLALFNLALGLVGTALLWGIRGWRSWSELVRLAGGDVGSTQLPGEFHADHPTQGV